jgi:hypothetical protein
MSSINLLIRSQLVYIFCSIFDRRESKFNSKLSKRFLQVLELETKSPSATPRAVPRAVRSPRLRAQCQQPADGVAPRPKHDVRLTVMRWQMVARRAPSTMAGAGPADGGASRTAARRPTPVRRMVARPLPSTMAGSLCMSGAREDGNSMLSRSNGVGSINKQFNHKIMAKYHRNQKES